jgi:hypothetical protein
MKKHAFCVGEKACFFTHPGVALSKEKACFFIGPRVVALHGAAPLRARARCRAVRLGAAWLLS